jgi:hypothetical protein
LVRAPDLRLLDTITAFRPPLIVDGGERWGIMPKTKGKIPLITFRAVQPIVLSDKDWKTLEKPYGYPISRQVRTQIKIVTARFLQFALAEDTGSMKDAVQRVTLLQNCARSLIKAIDARAISDVTRLYVNDALELNYARLKSNKLAKVLRIRTVPLAAHKSIWEIYADLEDFVNVCNLTLKEFDYVSQNDYWPRGGAWEVWIQQLTEIQRSQHLPTGARKDMANTASPFVELVYKLQTFLPKRHIRAQHSKVALASAIAKARRASHFPLAPKKARARKTGRNASSLHSQKNP